MDYVLKQRPSRLIAAARRAIRNSLQRKWLDRVRPSLEQSEERLPVISRATNDVVWEWNLQNDRIAFSENYQAVFGRENPPGGFAAKAWFEFIHPDAVNLAMEDKTMPFMDPPAITAAPPKVRPGSKIIITGDCDRPAGSIGPGSDDKGFLPKPFTTGKLLTIIRHSLVIPSE